jgi:hypothetical protein
LVVGILEIVFAICGSFPNINNCIGNTLLCGEIDDFAVHQSNLTARRFVDYDALTIFAEGSMWRPEGAENGRTGGDVSRFVGMFMSDFINESSKELDIARRPRTEMNLRLKAGDIR